MKSTPKCCTILGKCNYLISIQELQKWSWVKWEINKLNRERGREGERVRYGETTRLQMQLKIYLSQVVYTSLFGHVCSWWRWRWCESWFTHIHIHIHILCCTAVCLPVVPVDVPRINCVWLIENLHKINFNWKSCRQLVPDKKRLSEHSHIHTFTFTHTQLTFTRLCFALWPDKYWHLVYRASRFWSQDFNSHLTPSFNICMCLRV